MEYALSDGHIVHIDEGDYDLVNQPLIKWYFQDIGIGSVRGRDFRSKPMKRIVMQRFILGVTDKNIRVFTKDKDASNLRRSNIVAREFLKPASTGSRECKKCLRVMDLSCFNVNKTLYLGVEYICKKCRNRQQNLRIYGGEKPANNCRVCHKDIGRLGAMYCANCKSEGEKIRYAEYAERVGKDLINEKHRRYYRRHGKKWMQAKKVKMETDSEYAARVRERARLRYNPEKAKAYARNNAERIRAKQKIYTIEKADYLKVYRRQRVLNISDDYIKQVINQKNKGNFKNGEIPQHIVETERLLIQIHRELKTINNK